MFTAAALLNAAVLIQLRHHRLRAGGHAERIQVRTALCVSKENYVDENVGLFLKYAMKVPVFLNKLQFSGMAWAYIKFVERKFLPFRKSVEP